MSFERDHKMGTYIFKNMQTGTYTIGMDFLLAYYFDWFIRVSFKTVIFHLNAEEIQE